MELLLAPGLPIRAPKVINPGVHSAKAITISTPSAWLDSRSFTVSAWIRCAYGYQEPDDAAMLPLCNEWPKHYGLVLEV